jgi:hypothetical protein
MGWFVWAVASQFGENPMTAFADEVAKICLAEWVFFEKGKRKENEANAKFADDANQAHWYNRVGKYWREGVENKGINGRTLFERIVTKNVTANGMTKKVKVKEKFNPPWSSAFISYVMRTAGAGTDFDYHEAHSFYVIRALIAAEDATKNRKFLGRDPAEYVPKVGDIINFGREGLSGANFADFKKAFAKPQNFDNPKGGLATHSDIVVEVNSAKGMLLTVGGNTRDSDSKMANTVGHKTWELTKKGTLKSPGSLICVIETLL